MQTVVHRSVAPIGTSSLTLLSSATKRRKVDRLVRRVRPLLLRSDCVRKHCRVVDRSVRGCEMREVDGLREVLRDRVLGRKDLGNTEGGGRCDCPLGSSHRREVDRSQLPLDGRERERREAPRMLCRLWALLSDLDDTLLDGGGIPESIVRACELRSRY